ncbi:hypothetical protein GCM10011326_36900 [Salipiger profundus]|jgi:Flp pilus assembly protein TadG|uniref:Flp pilus assembly protein TadG n=2 Tax=Roseobacteraceae TaxID=2854170 RepID=A0A1U7D5X6_9RHOB|nr:Flp pilus assembly protein TadG [Salipiger profundus]GGA20865.1 hypothetical protein GCM10011326_36900 [Salipiger profundus]
MEADDMRPARLKSRLRRFAQETEGYVTLEVAIMIPALFVLFAAAWVYFDVIRQQAINQKANYAIGDMISRETDPVNSTYMDNAYRLLGLLTRNVVTPDPATGLHSSDLRVSVAEYNANNQTYKLIWSAARGDYPELTNGDMDDYLSRLPVLMNKAQLVIVETWEDYHPIFRVGLDAFEIRTYSFTHPRYASQVLWEGQNNGWGNGDQDAPGNSLCNNNAENATDCTNEDGTNNVEPNKKNRSHGG